MKRKVVYPAIESDWRLLLAADRGEEQVGYVKSISLSGAWLALLEGHALDPGRRAFRLLLRNDRLKPPELEITGVKEWRLEEGRQAFLEFTGELDREKRAAFVRFLSRSDRLQVSVWLLQEGEA